MELWDAYDRTYSIIDGVTLVRGEEKDIPQGMYHLVCNILVQHIDGTYLLMQRDPHKQAYPSMWEAAAGGSALQGETPYGCAVRELREETGIEAYDVRELGRFTDDGTHSFYVKYLCMTDCDKDSIRLQEGETIAYRWVTRDELLAMGNDELMSDRMREIVRAHHTVSIREERISAAEYIDFLKRTDLGSQYPKERFEQRIARLVNTVTISLVARNEHGEAVGVLFGLTDYCYWLYITDLGVDRRYERQGIGSSMMKLAHRLAGGEKDIAVYLIANENAVPFYKSLGMKFADDVMQYNHIDWTEFTVQ